MIQNMNAWGPDGCREHRAEIVEHIEKAYETLTFTEAWQATVIAAWSGLASAINPLDICGSLVDEAISRAAKASLGSNS
jgi:hypothetical protein